MAKARFEGNIIHNSTICGRRLAEEGSLPWISAATATITCKMSLDARESTLRDTSWGLNEWSFVRTWCNFCVDNQVCYVDHMSPMSQVYVKGGKWDHTECIDPSTPVIFYDTFGVLSARFILKYSSWTTISYLHDHNTCAATLCSLFLSLDNNPLQLLNQGQQPKLTASPRGQLPQESHQHDSNNSHEWQDADVFTISGCRTRGVRISPVLFWKAYVLIWTGFMTTMNSATSKSSAASRRSQLTKS